MKFTALMRLVMGAVLLAGLLPIASAAGASSTLYVSKQSCSNSGPGTSSHPYCTIQEGVNAATSGTTISIGSGTYTEQVVIGATKSNLILTGAGNGTVVKAPATMTSPKTIVDVSGATAVTIKDLAVAGPGGGGCDSLEYGIRVDNSGQATITDDHITKIEDNPFSGCQNGIAIDVGRASDSTSGQATITDNKIDHYQKGGIVVSNTSSSATISDNIINGVGPTTEIAQNGIEVGSGATATITDNQVKQNIYTGTADAASTGILLYNPGTVTVTMNQVNKNDVDIYGQGLTGSTVKQNTANNATYNGIFADSTSHGNSFVQNSARGTMGGSGNYDVEDDSTGGGTLGTANTWHQNGCKTSLPKGLCSS